MNRKHLLESDFQSDFLERVKQLFPGCIIIKNDPNYLQGFPDWTVLYNNKYAVLEMKQSGTAGHQPNQDIYVDIINYMGFSCFVFPENANFVLDCLVTYFSDTAPTRGGF